MTPLRQRKRPWTMDVKLTARSRLRLSRRQPHSKGPLKCYPKLTTELNASVYVRPVESYGLEKNNV